MHAGDTLGHAQRPERAGCVQVHGGHRGDRRIVDRFFAFLDPRQEAFVRCHKQAVGTVVESNPWQNIVDFDAIQQVLIVLLVLGGFRERNHAVHAWCIAGNENQGIVDSA